MGSNTTKWCDRCDKIKEDKDMHRWWYGYPSFASIGSSDFGGKCFDLCTECKGHMEELCKIGIGH
jgi:hypothetical protein